MSWNRFGIALTAIALSIFFSSTVLAWDPSSDCPPLPKKSIDAQMSAGELFNKAEKSYREGDSETSLKQFLCSFQIVQHENTVFNIAQIAKLSQERDVYLALLKDFVAKARGSVMVDPIREIIQELEGDDVAANSTGSKTVPTESEVNAAAESPMTTSETGGAATSKKATSRKRGFKAAGWALAGVGVVGLGTGAALQVSAAGAAEDAKGADTLSSFNSAESKMHVLQVGAIAGFAAGGAAAVAGAVCLFMANRDDERAAAVTVLPGFGGFTFVGRF